MRKFDTTLHTRRRSLIAFCVILLSSQMFAEGKEENLHVVGITFLDKSTSKASSLPTFFVVEKRVTIQRKEGDKWIATEYGRCLRETKEANKSPVYLVTLPPGEYRISGKIGLHRGGLYWDQMFSVPKELKKEFMRLSVACEKSVPVKCSLTVATPVPGPIRLGFSPNIIITDGLRSDGTPRFKSTRRLAVKSGQPVVFYVGSGVEQVRIRTGRYEFLTSSGDFQTVKVAVSDLVKGATIKFAKQKFSAEVQLLVKTPDGPKPLTAAMWKKLFPKAKRAPLINLTPIEIDPQGRRRRAVEDGGQYEWETGKLRYAFLKRGYKYMFRHVLRFAGAAFIAESGFAMPVALPLPDRSGNTPTCVSFGTLVFNLKPARTKKVTGTVTGKDGNPLAGAIVSFADPCGQKDQAKSNSIGQYTLRIFEGSYSVTVWHRKYTPITSSVKVSSDIKHNLSFAPPKGQQ
jgi:hypothetical protein